MSILSSSNAGKTLYQSQVTFDNASYNVQAFGYKQVEDTQYRKVFKKLGQDCTYTIIVPLWGRPTVHKIDVFHCIAFDTMEQARNFESQL